MRGVRNTDLSCVFGLLFMTNVIDSCKRKNEFSFTRSSFLRGMINQMIPEVFTVTLSSIFSFAIAFSDIKTGTVPRIAFVFAFPVFFTLCLLSKDPHSPAVLAASALLGLFVFLSVYLVSGKKLGLADVWYSALIGLVMGPWRWYVAVFCACIAGIIYMIAFKKHKIPFIPLMALGSVVVSIFQIFLQ